MNNSHFFPCDVICLTGKDRAKSINNMCTQNIAKAEPGSVTEAFITNPQGKTLAFCRVLVQPEQILLLSNSGGLSEALGQLQKYTIFDDVKMDYFLEGEMQSLRLAWNEELEKWLEEKLPEVQIHNNQTVAVINTDLNGHAYFIKSRWIDRDVIEVISSSENLQKILDSLHESLPLYDGVIDETQWQRLRIKAGWPYSGIDIRMDQLPQEVDRDKSAISFTKGCYLGQETVARLDALGHVNRRIMQIVITHSGGTELFNEPLPVNLISESGQVVGEIRSMATDGDDQLIGLAMIRIKALENSIQIENYPEAKISFHRIAESV